MRRPTIDLATIDAACDAARTLEEAAAILGLTLQALKTRRKLAFRVDPSRQKRKRGRKIGSPRKKVTPSS